MKIKALKALTLVAKIASVAGYVGGFLDPVQAGTVFAVSSIVKDLANRVGDHLDDGKVNDSFKTN